MDICPEVGKYKGYLYLSWALELNLATKHMLQVLCYGNRASLERNKVTDILTQFQTHKLVLINAFGAAVDIWARRMLLWGCRHGVRCFGMLGIRTGLGHGVFNSSAVASGAVFSQFFENSPSSILTLAKSAVQPSVDYIHTFCWQKPLLYIKLERQSLCCSQFVFLA